MLYFEEVPKVQGLVGPYCIARWLKPFVEFRSGISGCRRCKPRRHKCHQNSFFVVYKLSLSRGIWAEVLSVFFTVVEILISVCPNIRVVSCREMHGYASRRPCVRCSQCMDYKNYPARLYLTSIFNIHSDMRHALGYCSCRPLVGC